MDRHMHAPVLREHRWKLLVEILKRADQPGVPSLCVLEIIVLGLQEQFLVRVDNEFAHAFYKFCFELKSHCFDGCACFLHILGRLQAVSFAEEQEVIDELQFQSLDYGLLIVIDLSDLWDVLKSFEVLPQVFDRFQKHSDILVLLRLAVLA
jgi:hypothetical protein